MCAVAFRLYDIDGDNMVGKEDLESMLQLVIGEQLGEERIKTIAQRALDELDVDGDSKLSFSEFGKVRAETARFVVCTDACGYRRLSIQRCSRSFRCRSRVQQWIVEMLGFHLTVCCRTCVAELLRRRSIRQPRCMRVPVQ